MGLFKPRAAPQNNLMEYIDDCMRTIKASIGGKTKLTLVIRSDKFEKPIIMTNDHPEDTISAIRSMMDRKTSNDTVHVIQ